MKEKNIIVLFMTLMTITHIMQPVGLDLAKYCPSMPSMPSINPPDNVINTAGSLLNEATRLPGYVAGWAVTQGFQRVTGGTPNVWDGPKGDAGIKAWLPVVSSATIIGFTAWKLHTRISKLEAFKKQE